MKKHYTFLIVLLNFGVFAQTYIPIPESDAVWIQASFLYSAYNNHEHATITQPLSFGSDTLINGTSYHSLHGHAIADWIDGWGNPQTYQSGTDYLPDVQQSIFRQDITAKMVYQWDANTSQEAVLYDFASLVVGQPYPPTINNMDYPQILVMHYDSVLLSDGLYHERWTLGSDSNDSGFVAIIEGMGSTMGFNLPIAIPFEQGSAIMCFKVDSVVTYDTWANVGGLISPRYSENCASNLSVMDLKNKELAVNVWPNPANDFLKIESEIRIQKIVLLDLIGQTIFEQNMMDEKYAQISLSNLPAGNYLLTIYMEDNQRYIKRIVH